MVLYSLKEIGRLAYLESIKRSPKSILRLYNMTYFHSIVTHLAEHMRIIAPSSLYTESEERIFNALRGIARDSTNRSQESVRDIGIMR